MTRLSASLRPLAAGLALATAGFGATSALACPDYTLNGAPVRYSAADLSRPQAIDVIAGGDVDLATCNGGTHGYVITQPDFDLTFTDNDAGRDLTLRVEGTCDTVLLLNDATGQWHFSDDEDGTLNPAILVPNAPAGAYDIWVGTFGPSTCPAQLILSTAGTDDAPRPDAAPAAPDNLTQYRDRVGETLTFTLTGSASGSVWGTDVYTDDSSLAAAAVHAGVLMPGQTGQVAVTILPGQQTYGGSPRNGIASSNYGAWSGSFAFPDAVPADPGNLTAYRNQAGATLTFLVTGSTGGSVWGSGVYTDDSSLATAAVHAGVLTPGETAAVQVTLLPGQQSYDGSEANGIRTSNYGAWNGSFSFPAAPAASAPAAPAGK